ncbi:MAG: LysM peptidoglycan-binding domain-containing protein [bacterium]|nr:MAG: LysM peptidoglycan-binding domain-containing protein [bacterium]
MSSRSVIVLILLPLLLSCGCRVPKRGTTDGADHVGISDFDHEEEMYLIYPQLHIIQEKLDRAYSYFYFGDLESSLFLSEDLIKTIHEMKETVPEPAVCEFLETLEDRSRCLLERVSYEELERDSRFHITAVLDSITANHVVEDEIEIVFNWRTKHWIKYFQGRGRRNFRRWLLRAEKYRELIEPILIEVGIPRDLLYLAVIESGLNLRARSRMKAVGPWQFMAGTGRLFGLRINWWIDERRDIIASTYAAAHYLKHLHDLFGSWPLALASYNAGEYRVAHAISRQKTDDYWKLRLPNQTKWFVPKFMAALTIAREPSRYGFRKTSVEPIRFDIITIEQSTDLRLIAKKAGCTLRTLEDLNPALKRWATPPGMVIELKVPEGTGERCLEGLAEIPPGERVSWHKHRVKRGEALSRIADRYEISVSEIKRINGIRNVHRIREGKILLIPVKDATPAATASSQPGYRTPPKLPDKITMKRYRAPSGYRKIVYTVRDNDTLSEIAERFKVRLSRLRAWNNLRYTSLIHPGDRLVIYVPPDRAITDPAPEGVIDGITMQEKNKIVHIVRRGETLSSISRRYNISIARILAWNEGINRDKLYPGDRIAIWLD